MGCGGGKNLRGGWQIKLGHWVWSLSVPFMISVFETGAKQIKRFELVGLRIIIDIFFGGGE